jgi:hypothetical protein
LRTPPLAIGGENLATQSLVFSRSNEQEIILINLITTEEQIARGKRNFGFKKLSPYHISKEFNKKSLKVLQVIALYLQTLPLGIIFSIKSAPLVFSNIWNQQTKTNSLCDIYY